MVRKGVALYADDIFQVFVISGRDSSSLETWLGHLDVGLACEHGAFFKPVGNKDWEQLAPKGDSSWRQSVVSIMVCTQCPERHLKILPFRT